MRSILFKYIGICVCICVCMCMCMCSVCFNAQQIWQSHCINIYNTHRSCLNIRECEQHFLQHLQYTPRCLIDAQNFLFCSHFTIIVKFICIACIYTQFTLYISYFWIIFYLYIIHLSLFACEREIKWHSYFLISINIKNPNEMKFRFRWKRYINALTQ